MKQSQLPQDVAQKIVADNPQFRFLPKLLPLYIHVPRCREITTRPATMYQGWLVEEDRGRYIIHPTEFLVDTDGFRVGKRPEIRNTFYVGLPAQNHGDIINFQYVKNKSPFSLMLYEVAMMVPRTKHDNYLVDPDKLGNE